MLRRIVTMAAITLLALPLSATASDIAAGKKIFETNCSSCHGMTGKGDGPVGKVLNPPPRDFSKGDFKLDTDKDGKAGTDADLKNVITKGGAAFGGSALMAPWPGLSDDEVTSVILYVRSLKE